jgi:DNA-binding NarL/FixJ family response regulator
MKREFWKLSGLPMKIVVIEDHALMRDLLLRACTEAIPRSTARGAGDAASGLALCRKEKPGVVILDLALPDRDGLDLIDELLDVCPKAKIVGLSGYVDEFTVYRVLGSRLHGFVDKNEHNSGQLAAAIRGVLAGERYFSPRALRAWANLRSDPAAFDKILSAREQHLLRLFGQGLGNEDIAAAINLCELTVRNHRCRIMAKLGLRTSAELVTYAYAKGFVRAQPQGALGS